MTIVGGAGFIYNKKADAVYIYIAWKWLPSKCPRQSAQCVKETKKRTAMEIFDSASLGPFLLASDTPKRKYLQCICVACHYRVVFTRV